MRERHDELIASLREVGAQFEAPADGDAAFVDAVVRRTRSLPAPRARRRVRRRVLAVIAAVILVVVPGPRQAFARWLGIGSVRISEGSIAEGPTADGPTAENSIGEGSVATELPPAIRALDLGEPITATAASARLKRPIWKLPHGELVGIWIEPNRPMVNSVYRINGREVLISELPGPGNVYVLKKFLGQDSQLDFLTVRGEPAAWISGDPHEVAMLGPNGVEAVAVRLAGDVLLWADQTRTIRIEGIERVEDATALVESLGP